MKLSFSKSREGTGWLYLAAVPAQSPQERVRSVAALVELATSLSLESNCHCSLFERCQCRKDSATIDEHSTFHIAPRTASSRDEVEAVGGSCPIDIASHVEHNSTPSPSAVSINRHAAEDDIPAEEKEKEQVVEEVEEDNDEERGKQRDSNGEVQQDLTRTGPELRSSQSSSRCLHSCVILVAGAGANRLYAQFVCTHVAEAVKQTLHGTVYPPIHSLRTLIASHVKCHYPPTPLKKDRGEVGREDLGDYDIESEVHGIAAGKGRAVGNGVGVDKEKGSWKEELHSNGLLHIDGMVYLLADLQLTKYDQISKNTDAVAMTMHVTVPGLQVIKNFLTESEEASLLSDLYARPWMKLSKRQVQQYGHAFDYITRNEKGLQCSKVTPIPDKCQRIANRLQNILKVVDQGSFVDLDWKDLLREKKDCDHDIDLPMQKLNQSRSSSDIVCKNDDDDDDDDHDGNEDRDHPRCKKREAVAVEGVDREEEVEEQDTNSESSFYFNQLTVNRYPRGSGIGQHVDTHSAFSSCIASVSLGSSCVMVFQHGIHKELIKAVHLPPRCAVLMRGNARYGWLHGIKFREYDIVHGVKAPRGERLSLTFRQISTSSCTCIYPPLCDSRLNNISKETESQRRYRKKLVVGGESPMPKS